MKYFGEKNYEHGSKDKTGVLITNLGTPDAPDAKSLKVYLNQFLSDPRVIEIPKFLWQIILKGIILQVRPRKSAANYKKIWTDNGSPLLDISNKQLSGIKKILSSKYPNIEFALGMRYGNPSTQSKVREMVKEGCSKILFFPLYPHYAGATSATANDQFFRALMKEKWQPVIRVVEPYFEQPLYIDALAKSVEDAYAKKEIKPDVLVCSYHGVPKRYLMQGDPYHCQCQKTTRLLKERLGWKDTDIITTFQSKFGPEEWLKPYTVEEVARLVEEENKKSIAVIAPAFSSDCIETLEEINEEIKESFEEAGGEEFTYIPCLNDNNAHISALSSLIEKNLSGWID